MLKKMVTVLLSFVLLTVSVSTYSANAIDSNHPYDPGKSDIRYAKMTIVPYGPVSDKIDAEIRVGIYNANKEGEYTVKISCTNDFTTQSLPPVTKHAGEKERVLFNAYINTAGMSGTYIVTADVYKNGILVAQTRDQLIVIPVSSASRAVPLVTTVFMDPGAFVANVYPSERAPVEQDVRDKIDALNEIGVKSIILTYAEYILNGWGAFYPSQIAELTEQVTLIGNTAPTTLTKPLNFDFIGTVLDQAEKNGQKVLIGIGRGTDAWITFDTRGWLRPEAQSALNPEYLKQHVDFAKAVTDEIYELYKNYDSFCGWYMSHECQDINWANLFYNPVADHMHAIAPEKPVLASPAAVTPWLIVNQMRTALATSRVDIFSYQDSVGPGYDETRFMYTYDPQIRLGQLDAMYQKYLAEHQNSAVKKHFWSNSEAWEMAGPTYSNAYAADFDRYKQQIEIVSKYVDSISSYEAGGFLESPASTLKLGGPSAADLYSGYKDYYDAFMDMQN